MKPEPILAVSGLSKSFRSRARKNDEKAVDNVSFEAFPGRTLAIVGESGAGKSTVGRMVVRLIDPDEGSIVVNGREIASLRGKQLRSVRADIHMVFQQPGASFNPKIQLGESIGEPLLVQSRMRVDDRRRRVHEVLTQVGLDVGFANRFPSELSGGQLQRASIARSLVTAPKVIVLDESVAALDVSVQAQILNLLYDVQAQTNVAYVFITHDLLMAQSFAQDVLVMRSGVVVAAGAVETVFSEPMHPYVADLMRAVPRLGGGPSMVGEGS